MCNCVAVCLLVLFFVTGYAVSPQFSDNSGNLYNAKTAMYFVTLMLHYFFGGVFVATAVIGGARSRTFDSDVRQASFVGAWSLLLASWWTTVAVHTLMPEVKSG